MKPTDLRQYETIQEFRAAVEVMREFQKTLGAAERRPNGEITGPIHPVVTHIATAYEGLKTVDGTLAQESRHRGKTSFNWNKGLCSVNLSELEAGLGSFVGNYLMDDSYSSLKDGKIVPSNDMDNNITQLGSAMWILEEMRGPQPTLAVLSDRKSQGCVFKSWKEALAFMESLPAEENERVDVRYVTGKYSVRTMPYDRANLPNEVKLVSRAKLLDSVNAHHQAPPSL